MGKRNTLLIIAALVLVFIALFSLHHNKKPSGPELGPIVKGCSATTPSKETLASTFKTQSTFKVLQGYTVQQVTEPVTCWDVVKLIKQGDVENQTAILQRVGNSIYLSAGPSTSFPKSLMEQLSVPTKVQSSVVVYDDTTQSSTTESD